MLSMDVAPVVFQPEISCVFPVFDARRGIITTLMLASLKEMAPSFEYSQEVMLQSSCEVQKRSEKSSTWRVSQRLM